MSVGALVGTGIGLSLLGSSQQAEGARDAARFNERVALEDIKLIQTEERQKRRLQREAGGRQLGAIQAAAASSGVSAASGSALDALAEQAAVNARNEFLIGFESELAQARTLQAARQGSISARNQAAGFMLSGLGSAIGTGATFLAARG